MSIFSKLVGIAAPLVGGFFGGPAGFAAGSAVGAAFQKAPKAPAAAPGFMTTMPVAPGFGGGLPTSLVPIRGARLPALPRAPGLPPGLPVPVAPGGFGAGAGGACPAGFHLDKRTRSRCVRNRRMNPLNGRAATRAIRRIKGARKMLQKIERQLPKTRTRRTPAHGHRVSVKAT